METRCGGCKPHPLHDLETFLGGMETRDYEVEKSVLGTPLKPSLVEWKLVLLHYFLTVFEDLETFLGGMETRTLPGAHCIQRPLKPSLVEWKPGILPGNGGRDMSP